MGAAVDKDTQEKLAEVCKGLLNERTRAGPPGDTRPICDMAFEELQKLAARMCAVTEHLRGHSTIGPKQIPFVALIACGDAGDS